MFLVINVEKVIIIKCVVHIIYVYNVIKFFVLPVPIPNTEVKLTGVDNTRLVTAREDRLLPDYISPFANKRGGTFLLPFPFVIFRKKCPIKM